MSGADVKRSWGPWLRGTAYGFPFGALPAGGAEIPTFLSYVTEKRLAARKGRDEFGEGAIEGVAGPEAANNASAAGTFVPLLALGLPVTATSAVMLAALQGYGIEPGPGLMTDQPELVWALLASLLIGNVLLLVLNLPLAPLWAKLLRIPRPQLYAGILFFAALGAYAANLQAFDLFLLLLLGLLGLMMRRFGLPVLPLILGVILGPLMEFRLREAMAISGGDVSALWSEPLAIVIYVVVSIAVVAPFAVRRLRPTPAAVAADQSLTTTTPTRGEGAMTTGERIVVGWTPDEFGEVALHARRRGGEAPRRSVVVVNATRGDALVDDRFADEEQLGRLTRSWPPAASRSTYAARWAPTSATRSSRWPRTSPPTSS